MIRRDVADSFLLITQDDHAHLASELARRIGNDRFAAPSPFELTIQAIRHHDSGWPLHDDKPILNTRSQPLHVFETPFPLAIRLWSAAVEQARLLGAYQGLLVSLHVLGLSSIGLRLHPNTSRADLFEINKFQHKQIEIQEELRRELGLTTEAPLTLGLAPLGTSPAEDLLLFDFRLLTMVDRISLALCCGQHLFPTMDDVHPKAGQRPLPIHATMPDAATMTLDPWPFDQRVIALEVPARRVSNRAFEDVDLLREAYAAAPINPVKLTVRSP